MLALSQTSGYAVLALSCLDDPGQRWVLLKDIAEFSRAPTPYLAQILHALSCAGLIEGKRGYRGGYRLLRPAQSISVLEVVEAVDGVQCFGGCLLGLEGCSDARACPMHEFWKVEKARIRASLAKRTLKDVAAFERRRGARRAEASAALQLTRAASTRDNQRSRMLRTKG